MPPSTKERLAAAGLELFTRHGIGQVGLDRVISQAGVTKTTFYNHFSGKEDLLREAIALEERDLMARLEGGVRDAGQAGAREQLLALFDVFEQVHDEGRRVLGLTLNALLEFPDKNDPTHAVAADKRRALQQLVRSLAERLGVDRPAPFADRLALILGGVLLEHRLTGDAATLREARALAALAVNDALANQP